MRPRRNCTLVYLDNPRSSVTSWFQWFGYMSAMPNCPRSRDHQGCILAPRCTTLTTRTPWTEPLLFHFKEVALRQDRTLSRCKSFGYTLLVSETAMPSKQLFLQATCCKFKCQTTTYSWDLTKCQFQPARRKFRAPLRPSKRCGPKGPSSCGLWQASITSSSSSSSS